MKKLLIALSLISSPAMAQDRGPDGVWKWNGDVRMMNDVWACPRYGYSVGRLGPVGSEVIKRCPLERTRDQIAARNELARRCANGNQKACAVIRDLDI